MCGTPIGWGTPMLAPGMRSGILIIFESQCKTAAGACQSVQDSSWCLSVSARQLMSVPPSTCSRCNSLISPGRVCLINTRTNASSKTPGLAKFPVLAVSKNSGASRIRNSGAYRLKTAGSTVSKPPGPTVSKTLEKPYRNLRGLPFQHVRGRPYSNLQGLPYQKSRGPAESKIAYRVQGPCH